MDTKESKQREVLDQIPVEAIFQQAEPNAPIDLGNHKVSLTSNSNSKTTTGNFSIRFTPDKSFIADFPSELSDMESLFSENTSKIHFSEFDTSHEAFLVSGNIPGTLTYRFSGSPISIHAPSDDVNHAIFNLFNWPDFGGPESFVLKTGIEPHSGSQVCGRFTLEFESWRVCVTATQNTSEIIKALNKTGGYSITHVGSIHKIDNSPFSTSELQEVLNFLRYFFSFALGIWSSPSLTVGFDASNKRIFEDWSLRRQDRKQLSNPVSSFDEQHPEILPSLVKDFWNLWANDTWKESLRNSIYWYVKSNQGGSGLGVDAALILSQAALELLSWTYCVLDRKMISAQSFQGKGLSASDKLRILASSLNIPLEIPQNLTSLIALGKERNLNDSMGVITWLRNRVVHPGKEISLPKNAYYEAWRLSMWYLDLIFLGLCSYNGNYANRLKSRWVGEVEPVPWSV